MGQDKEEGEQKEDTNASPQRKTPTTRTLTKDEEAK
jgi:hypothetical protein